MNKRVFAPWVMAVIVALLGSCTAPSQPSASQEAPTIQEQEPEEETRLCLEGVELSATAPRELVVSPGGGLNSEPYLLWGIQQGCFERFGLEVVNSPNPSQADRNAALIGGSVDIAMSVNTNLVQAYANSGLLLKVVAPVYALSPSDWEIARVARSVDGKLLQNTALLVNPELGVDSVADLKGLRIGSISFTGPNGLGLFKALEEAGLTRGDIEAISMSTELQIAAFEAGDLDGIIVSGADVANALAEGAQFVLYPSVQFLEPGTPVLWATTQETVSEKTEEIRQFREAVRATNAALSTSEGFELFKDFLVDNYGVSREDVERTAFPSYPTSDVDPAEFEYLVRALLLEGQIEKEVDVSDFLLSF